MADICSYIPLNAHIPGVPMLVVEAMLMIASVLVPVTVSKFIPSPALIPTVAG